MITDKDIDNLAELSRLELSIEEKAGYAADLSRIVDYIKEIQTVDVGNIDTIGDSIINIMRDDVVTTATGSNTESLVRAAADNDGVYIKVKKVL